MVVRTRAAQKGAQCQDPPCRGCKCMPVRILITEGTRADCKEAIHLIDGISAETLLADREYDTNQIVA